MDPKNPTQGYPSAQGYPSDQPPAYQFQQPATTMPTAQAAYPYPAPPQGYAYPEPPQTQQYPPHGSSAQYPYLPPSGQPAYPVPQPNPPYPVDSKGQLEANTAYPAPPPFKGDTGAVPITTQPGPTATTVIIQPQSLSKHPQMLFCSRCQKNVNSQVQHVPGAGTYISAGLCFCFGCWLCCCLPFCMDDLQDTEHRCPDCKTILGAKKCM